MDSGFLIGEPTEATWLLLTDGQARSSLPRSSHLEQVPGKASFRFRLEVNQGESLGPVGFVRAESPVDGGANVGAECAVNLTLLKSDALFRVTVYLRSSAKDVDLQYVTELAGPQTLPIREFRFVKWGREQELSPAERDNFLAGINRFGLQIARSRQGQELNSRPFAGEFGLAGPVALINQ
jgi:hypothetical protein